MKLISCDTKLHKLITLYPMVYAFANIKVIHSIVVL